jgi:predicted chitinase
MKISEISTNEGKLGDIAKAGAVALSTMLPSGGQASAPETSPIPVTRSFSETITETKEEQLLLKIAKNFGIKGDELAALMAQAYHETMGFTRLSEMGNENYFKRYNTPRMAKRLGNTEPDDYKKFIGRGYFHTTGRYNYQKVQDTFGIPVVDNPELLETNIEYALKASLYFWASRVRARVSDFSDTRAVTRAVNGGTYGLSQRTKLFDIYKNRLTQINESTRFEGDDHDVSVSFSYGGPNISLNLLSNKLSKYYEELSYSDIRKIWDNEDDDFEKVIMKGIHENAEKQIVELTNAYVNMVKAIITDTSNKVQQEKKKRFEKYDIK